MTTETVTYVGPYEEVGLVLPDGREEAVEHGGSIEVDVATAKNLIAQETWEYEGDGPPDSPGATDGAVELAAELSIDLDDVEGSGQDGRITKADVEAAAEESGDGDGDHDDPDSTEE